MQKRQIDQKNSLKILKHYEKKLNFSAADKSFEGFHQNFLA